MSKGVRAAGLRIGLLLALVSSGSLCGTVDSAAAASSWVKPYEDGQRLLLGRKFDKAAEQLEQAILLRPRPGCRLRTYGVKFRDYLPYYYLAVAHHEMGHAAAARDGLTRSLAEGVVSDCASARAQAVDLRERLARLEMFAGGGAPSAPSANAPWDILRAEVGELHQAALEADAQRLAPELLRRGQAKLADADGERSVSVLVAASDDFVRALSRSRTDGPLLALLEQDATEAVERARLAKARLPAAVLVSPGAVTATSALESAARLLAEARSPAEWLEVERRAEDAARELRRLASAAASLRDAERSQLLTEAELVLALADSARQRLPEARRSSPDAVAARSSLEEARRTLTAEASIEAIRGALTLAKSARRDFAKLADLSLPALDDSRGGQGRELLGLAWSERLEKAGPALLPAAAKDASP